MLAATLHDGIFGVSALVNTQGESQIGVLTRANLEAHADFVNSLGDNGYPLRISLGAAQEEVKFWNEGAMLADGVGNSKFAHECRNRAAVFQDRVATLRAAGATEPPSKLQKVSSQLMPAGAVVLYRNLCSVAHNDLRSLIERFDKGHMVALGQPLDAAQLAALLWINASLAHALVHRVPEFADGPVERLRELAKVADRTYNRIGELRRLASDELQASARATPPQ